jgi:uncharacterized protein with HEPN domain
VDWRGFAGLRDMATQCYFGIDTRQLLPIIQNEVLKLLAAVEAELQKLQGLETHKPLGFTTKA